MTLTGAGIKSFDVWTSVNTFAGVIAWRERSDTYAVYFDSNCARGSKRSFKSVDEAVAYITARRIKKGWRI
jgi:hypothetical protein